MGHLTPNNVFGKIFRLWRMNAGMTQRDLADRCFCVKSEISKIEKGQRRPPHRIVEKADEATGANGELLEMLGEFSWDGIKEGFPEYLQREAKATKIRIYEPSIIHGLLQTEAYARAIITGGRPDAKPDAIDDLVTTRMDRQEIFSQEGDPPELVIVLDELALRRPRGGVEVHRAQLDALLKAAVRPEVTLRVIPLSTPLCVGLACSFAILSFDSTPPIAYSEDPGTGRLTDTPDLVERYVAEFEAIRTYALPVEASLDLIRKVRDEIWT